MTHNPLPGLLSEVIDHLEAAIASAQEGKPFLLSASDMKALTDVHARVVRKLEKLEKENDEEAPD